MRLLTDYNTSTGTQFDGVALVCVVLGDDEDDEIVGAQVAYGVTIFELPLPFGNVPYKPGDLCHLIQYVLLTPIIQYRGHPRLVRRAPLQPVRIDQPDRRVCERILRTELVRGGSPAGTC